MITHRPENWIASPTSSCWGGAAWLIAATLAHDGGAEVLVLETADLIRATTGVSGGMPWIACNRHMAEEGARLHPPPYPPP